MSTLFDVTGKRVVVTGASRGIGRAIAAGFAGAGASVYATARTEAALVQLRDEIVAAGGTCDYYAADLAGEDAAKTLIANAVDSMGGIDVLVNNAGVDLEENAFDFPYEEFERILAFNVSTMFATMREAARQFVDQGAGKIINVTSVLSSVGIRGDSAYIASKHGLLGLTRALSLEWARKNIQVNALAPGFVVTEMTRNDYENEAVLKSILSRTPVGRVAQPEDMVGGAIFLASSASDFMTGQTLYLDGGWTVA